MIDHYHCVSICLYMFIYYYCWCYRYNDYVLYHCVKSLFITMYVKYASLIYHAFYQIFPISSTSSVASSFPSNVSTSRRRRRSSVRGSKTWTRTTICPSRRSGLSASGRGGLGFVGRTWPFGKRTVCEVEHHVFFWMGTFNGKFQELYQISRGYSWSSQLWCFLMEGSCGLFIQK